MFSISYDTFGTISFLYDFPQWKYSVLTLLHTYVQNKFPLQGVSHFCHTAHRKSNITNVAVLTNYSTGDALDTQRLFAGAQFRQFLEHNLKYNVLSTCQACLRAEGGYYNTYSGTGWVIL